MQRGLGQQKSFRRLKWNNQLGQIFLHKHGGMKRSSVNILRLLSELEGSYQLTKYMAFDDDMNILNEMKERYYKLYFKLNKEEKQRENIH